MVDNLKQRTFKAFAWDLSGKLADQGLGFFISILLARLLAPEEFGLLAMAAVIISLSQVLIDSGLGTALIQRQEVRDDHYGSVFFFNMVVGTLLTLIFFFAADKVAGFYARPELKPIVQALSFSFIINSFARVQSAWLSKQLKLKVITQARIIALVISGTLGVSLAILNYGVWALVVQSLVGAFISSLYISLSAGWRPRLVFSWIALKELWGFGFRVFISGLINTITSQLDRLIIGKIFSAETLGYYQRSKSLNDFVVKYTSGSLMPVLFPALSSVQHDRERYNAIVLRSFHLLSFVAFFIVGFLFLAAEDVVIVLFTAKWLPSVIFFKILILSGFVYPYSALLVNILASKGNSKAFLKQTLLKEVLVILNLIVGFSFGLLEYLYGFTLVYYLALIINIQFAAKEMKINSGVFYRIIVQYIAITAFISSLYYLLIFLIPETGPFLSLLLAFTFFSVAYFVISVLFKLDGFLLLKKEVFELFNKKSQ